MKFKFLGTAAAEAIPALFCNCPTCRKSRELGGRNIRTRSQALINDDLMIDFGPDTYFHICRYDLDCSKLRYLLVTHAHDDHLTPTELAYRMNGYAYLNGDKKNDDKEFPALNLYISEESSKYITADYYDEYSLKINKAEAFKEYDLGKYKIVPLTAKHAPGYGALIYIISDGEKTILYAHDTGLFAEDTMKYLAENKPYFDFVSIDCTGMKNPCGKYHMGIADNVVIRQKTEEMGCTDGNTVWYCNHFSHNGECTYDEFTALAGQYGFNVSYDGLELEI